MVAAITFTVSAVLTFLVARRFATGISSAAPAWIALATTPA